MKLQQERVSPAPKTQEGPAQLKEQGKTMAPPSFQLASPDGAGPVQQKPQEGKEQLPAVQVGGVKQLQQVPDSQQTLTTASPAGAVWDDFAVKFNKEFQSVLHVFDPEQMAQYPGKLPAANAEASAESATPAGQIKYAGKGEASGAAVSAAQLQELFTEGQRDKLTSFMDSKIIPERLFNGDDIGKTTAQQRLLMAGLILTRGKYQPGSFEQKVHARMCWHWVHITHHYAGATPGGALNQGMMGSFDHDNNVVLGSGKLEEVFHGKGVQPEDLPKEYDTANHIGPIPEGSAHKEALGKEQAAKEKDPTAKGSIKMLKTMPFEDLAKLQPGDWLWYYNANGSGIGSHSVIFSRWAGPVQEKNGVKYRKAICFSQGRPEWGGREHEANLGERFMKDDSIQISPVNYVTRVSADSNPADTVEELLPKSAEKKEKALQSGNEKYIGKAEKQFNKPVDREKVKEILREKNNGLIEKLDERLTEGQKKLLAAANASDEIETLVRLFQRLAKIANNAEIVGRNQESTNEKKGAEYDAVHEKVAAEEAKLNAEIAALDAEKADLEKKVTDLTGQKDTLDTAPESKAKKKEADGLHQKIKDLERKHKKDPGSLKSNKEYVDMKTKRDALRGEVTTLNAEGVTNKKEIDRLKGEIAKLKKKLAGIPWARKGKVEKLGAAEKKLPFSLVHPGNWKGESKGGTTGKLEEVMKVAEFEKALGEGELPKPEVKVKPKGKGKGK